MTGPRPLGRPEHAEVNRLLAACLEGRRPLVLAHRGTAVGAVAENTLVAARAALASGADMVEIDVTGSRDGAFLAFHDGTEQENLGVRENLRDLTGARIAQLRYVRVDRRDRPARVEPLVDVLTGLRARPGAESPPPLVNLDRSWPWWPTLLPLLDELDMTPQLLLKSPAGDGEALGVLRSHPEPYPYLPICTDPAQVEQLLADPALNLVGAELLAPSPDHPFADPAYVAALHDRGLLVLVNAEVLTNGVPLFAGFDDERALEDGPDAGWGPLLDLGADVVQTDWPWLLHAYRERRAAAGTPCPPAEPVDQEGRP